LTQCQFPVFAGRPPSEVVEPEELPPLDELAEAPLLPEELLLLEEPPDELLLPARPPEELLLEELPDELLLPARLPDELLLLEELPDELPPEELVVPDELLLDDVA
jgi:hypothetical protein